MDNGIPTASQRIQTQLVMAIAAVPFGPDWIWTVQDLVRRAFEGHQQTLDEMEKLANDIRACHPQPSILIDRATNDRMNQLQSVLSWLDAKVKTEAVMLSVFSGEAGPRVRMRVATRNQGFPTAQPHDGTTLEEAVIRAMQAEQQQSPAAQESARP